LCVKGFCGFGGRPCDRPRRARSALGRDRLGAEMLRDLVVEAVPQMPVSVYGRRFRPVPQPGR
jgi:hypothetical protein